MSSTPYLAVVKVGFGMEARQGKRDDADGEDGSQAEYEYAATNEEELSIAEEQLLYVLEDDDQE